MAQICEECKKKEAQATAIARTSNKEFTYNKFITQRGVLSI